MNIDIDQISIEGLPHVIEHELAQFVTLENHLTTLENYAVIAKDDNLHGRDLEECKNLCAYYNPSISTESLTVSTEGILTLIIGTIAVVIIAIAAFIARGFQIGKRLMDSNISDQDYQEAVNRLGKGVSLFSNEVLNEAKKIAASRQEVKGMDLSKATLSDIMQRIRKVTSDTPREVEDLIMLFITIRDQLGLKFNKPFTMENLLEWANELERKSVADSILLLIKMSGNDIGKDSILSLEALNLDPNATALAIGDGAEVIRTTSAEHKVILKDKTLYVERVKKFDASNERLNELPRNYIAKRGDSGGHIALIVKNLKNSDWTRLHKTVENELREFAKLDNKSSVRQYIKPYTDVLENLAGHSDIDEKRVSDDVKRITQPIPRQAGRLMSEYTRFLLMIHRYKRFIVKTHGVIERLDKL